jgi:preprotein translocase subunit SecY
MFEFLTKKPKKSTKPTQKILITIFILILFRLGNTIPLAGIDQEALKKSLLQLNLNNSLMQFINMYSGGGNNILSPLSLGIIPFINASIILDLLTATFPFFEKLQSEEGEFGRKKLLFYKKILAFLFAFGQSIFLISYIKSYYYDANLFNMTMTGLELISGSSIIIWFCAALDNKGIGNGTSLIILTNIVTTALGKNQSYMKENFNLTFLFEIVFLFLIIALICVSQTARINIDVVSARQLAFLGATEKASLKSRGIPNLNLKENGLSIRLNQSGIFPIIIASNLLPFLSYLTENLGSQKKVISTLCYYFLIIGFNYFYTILFWDPEKISEQLRKASVSIINVTPGQATIVYLEKVVRSSSILGGTFLCIILGFYDFLKQILNGALLNQLNISSLIIIVGVAYEIQKTIRALYKNNTTKID